jgi:mercuric ion binding protein
MKTVIIFMFSLVLLLGFGVIGFDILHATVEALSKEYVTHTKEVTLKVDGMSCSMCPLTIKTALRKLDGVTDVDVSYRDKEAKVRYEEGKVTVDEIVKAIENAGKYKASVITRESKPGT